MKILNVITILAVTFFASSAFAEEGVERVGEGAVKAVTAPGEIVESIKEETADKDAAGVVTGSVVGSAKAAEKVVEGAADIAVGTVETLLSPLTGGDD
jgi:hypothetical protein